MKWFNQAKGFGFILPDGGGADVFVHVSALTKAGLQTLGEGQRVTFDLAQDRGKTMAADIQTDGPAPPPPPRGGGGGGGGFRRDDGGGGGGGFRQRGGFDGGGRGGGGFGGGGHQREARGPAPSQGPRSHAGIFDALNMVVLRVRDLKSARAWYERVLELKVAEENPSGQTVVLDLGRGANLCLWQLGADEKPAGSDIATAFPNFRSGDVEGIHGKLDGLGVTVTPLNDSGGVKWFSFFDTDGNRIDVVQNRPRAF